MTLEGKRAAVMIGPQFEDAEAIYPLYRLREAGAEVTVIGLEAGVTVPAKKGVDLETERAAGDLGPDDLDLLVIAGGFGPSRRLPTTCATRGPTGRTPRWSSTAT